jgi:hypothetical protein
MDYIIESLNENEIWLMITSSDMFLRALKSSLSASRILFKLTRKSGFPALSFEITFSGQGGNDLFLTQDVPVTVLTQAETLDYNEPMVPDPEIHVMMPPLIKLKSIIEKMKSLSDFFPSCIAGIVPMNSMSFSESSKSVSSYNSRTAASLGVSPLSILPVGINH